MKAIRDYSDGQWLVLLWAFIVLFLAAGLFLGITALVVVAVLGGAGAGYTTYLYAQGRTGPTGRSDIDSDEGGRA